MHVSKKLFVLLFVIAPLLLSATPPEDSTCSPILAGTKECPGCKKNLNQELYQETFAGTITVDRLQELTEQGADVNYEEPDGTRPLDQALLTGNKAVAHALQKKGAQATQSGLHLAIGRVSRMQLVGSATAGVHILNDFKKAGMSQPSDEVKKALKMIYANDSYCCKNNATKPANAQTLNACESKRLLAVIFNTLDIKIEETIEVIRIS